MQLDIKRILESRKVPTLPAAAVKILKLIGSNDPDRTAIANTIKTDPGIAAKVLQASNSACFGLRVEVRSIDHAVVLLGPGTLSSLCLTFSLSNFSFPGAVATQDFRSVWEQSILRAVAAETIAQSCGYRDTSVFFLQALLCDLGRLAILAVEPVAYHDVFEEERLGIPCIVDYEKEFLGIDHVEVGRSLVEKWRLPELYASTIQYHHSSSQELLKIKEDSEFVGFSIVAMASLVAEFILFGQVAEHYDEIVNIASECLELDSDLVSTIISDVRESADSLPSDFGLDVTSLPSPEELRDLASELLTTICMRADLAIEAATVSQEQLQVETESLKETCDELRIQANIDYLTQLYNRGFFDLYLVELLSHQLEVHPSVGVIICDIDNFKAINDEFGHQAGDVVLQAVAERISDTVTAREVVARYGGEEFVIATSRRPANEVLELAESIRKSVGATPYTVGGKHLHVTLSAGFATTHDFPSQDGVGRGTLLRAADEALYTAKNSGRDCVVGWRADLRTVNVDSFAPHMNMASPEMAARANTQL